MIAKARQRRRRKPPRWGPCRLCGLPAFFQCARCGHWRCSGGVGAGRNYAERPHYSLRKVRNEIGVYRLVCWPRCILRKLDKDEPEFYTGEPREWTEEERAAFRRSEEFDEVVFTHHERAEP